MRGAEENHSTQQDTLPRETTTEAGHDFIQQILKPYNVSGSWYFLGI